MLCPRCGSESSAPGGRCPSCNTLLVARSASDETVTAGAVTPRSSSAADRPLDPGTAFGTRYQVLRLLGAGGMGAVYQAWDKELGVAVALKIIRADLTSDPHVAAELERRFKRELLLARQITHRHVVRIHDLGEVGGIKYLSMPFVDGRDLGAMLREGAVPVPRALRLARQLADGLQAAHQAGVVHRDLKPENVMIDADDQVVIMDFGISRSTSGATMTADGAVMGTLEYMAPEQARGTEVDHRADIYAFGLILYDMIAGRRRLERRESAVVEMMSRMQESPRPLRAIVPDLPAGLDAIVARCLQPDPENRFKTTADLVAALQCLDDSGRSRETRRSLRRRAAPIAVAAAIAVAIGMLGFKWRAGAIRQRVETPPAANLSLLVADLDNAAKDPVFDGSIEQAVAIAMEGSPLVSVYPAKNAHALAASLSPSSGGRLTQDVALLVARREGIDVLLSGTIDRAGDGYRLEIQATDPDTGRRIVSAERRASGKSDVLVAVSSLAVDIRRGLGESASQLTRTAAAETFTAGSVDAMRAYARGQDLLSAGRYREALTALQEALGHDPKLGRAHAAMGAIYVNLKQPERARASFQEALKYLDRMTDREKYRTLATYYIGVVGNYDKAIENYEALIRGFPADNAAYGNLALSQLRAGRPGAVSLARQTARTGLEIHPKNVLQRVNYAAYSLYAGDFETGAREAERVIAESPRYEFGYLTLALSRAAGGDVAAAGGVYDRLAQVSEAGRSLSTLGRADLEMYSGVLDGVASLLAPGVALDLKLQSSGELAMKHVVLAEAELASGTPGDAVERAEKALLLDGELHTQVSAARVLIAAGRERSALQVADRLEAQLQNQTKAYADLLRGEIALARRKLPEAIGLLKGARDLHDGWLIRYVLGRAYFEAGPEHAPEALDEFARCYDRRGEAADVFFADSPTMRYLPQLYYWLGRAREAVSGKGGSADAAYNEYMKIRRAAPRDPLLSDIRNRLSTSR